MQAFIDYYKLLMVNSSASDTEIKHQFHRLAMSSHPDHGGSELAMRQLNDAYSVLSNPTLKSKYDEVYRQYYQPAAHSAPFLSRPAYDQPSWADYTEVNVKYSFIVRLKDYLRYQLLFDLAWLLLKLLYGVLNVLRALF